MGETNDRKNGVLIIIPSQVHSTNIECKLYSGFIRDLHLWGSLTMIQVENKA